MSKHELLGQSFIKALNDFEKLGNVNIRMSGNPMAHASIIVDRNDDSIVISSPTTIHMSHKQLVYMDQKLNKAGKYSWLMIKRYVSLINDPSIAKRVHELNPEQSKYFLKELFTRMLTIIDAGEYNTDNIRECFQAMYNAFDNELDAMILGVIMDILDDRETETNVCRTCQHCHNMNGIPGYGRCDACTFEPSEDGKQCTIQQFQDEYGSHVFSDHGIIYTDITTGETYCEDYLKRPINVGGVLKTWFVT